MTTRKTKATIATTETTIAEAVMTFNELVKEGYNVAQSVNGADSSLAVWFFHAVTTPLTKEETAQLKIDVTGWYSAGFAKHINGALGIAFKMDIINDNDKRLNLYLKKSFNAQYQQLRDWKQGKEPQETTAKAKVNSTKEKMEDSDGSILSQCMATADAGISDVKATLILFGKLINDLSQELTAEQNAHIITVLDGLSDYVLKGE